LGEFYYYPIYILTLCAYTLSTSVLVFHLSERIVCFLQALTEPDYGSDESSLKTAATKVPGGWHLDGQKRWIGNSTFADMLIILARNADTNQLNGKELPV